MSLSSTPLRSPASPFDAPANPVQSTPLAASTATSEALSLLEAQALQAAAQLAPTILVVDGEKMLRLVLRQALENQGYEVWEAGDADTCLQQCTLMLPDLILIDLGMPGLAGLACCEQLRLQWGDRCPPIIITATLYDGEIVDRAFALGVSDYVTRPFHWAVLRQRIQLLLQTRWAMNQLELKIQQEELLVRQLEATNQAIAELVRVDAVTELANDRALLELLPRTWGWHIREQLPLSLVWVDWHGLESCQLHRGIDGGNQGLRAIAHGIQKVLKRPADYGIRVRAGRFALLLSNTPLAGAQHVLDLLRSQLRDSVELSLTDNLKDSTVPPGSEYEYFSYGIVSLIPTSQLGWEQFLGQGDVVLAQSKRERQMITCQTIQVDLY